MTVIASPRAARSTVRLASRLSGGPTLPRARRRPARPTPESVAVISSALTMVCLVCGWMCAQLLFFGGLSQDRAQTLLHDEFRQQLAAATAPVGPSTPVGAPVARISVPSVGVDQIVVEGTASGDLLAGPGHRRDTVLPGQVGTSVVYGRSSTYGQPFRRLPEVKAGATVTVVVGQGEKSFRVLGVRRAGDPLPQPAAAGAARLVLVTTEGRGRLAALSPGATMYVDAEASEGFPAPPRPAAALPAAEGAMATDDGALPLLVVCLFAVLGLTLGVVAARQRWPARLVWVLATPLAIALSWWTTDVVMRLLPNLI